jgi:hypothetical protein
MRARRASDGRSSGTRERLRNAAAGRAVEAAASSAIRAPSHEEIAIRAYEIFLRRGAGNGDEVQDWLAAEQELLSGLTAAASAQPTSADDAEPAAE